MKKILFIAILAGAAYFVYKKFAAETASPRALYISLSNGKPAVSHMNHMRDGGFLVCPTSWASNT